MIFNKQIITVADLRGIGTQLRSNFFSFSRSYRKKLATLKVVPPPVCEILDPPLIKNYSDKQMQNYEDPRTENYM